ncbi:MAG: PAS domain-containing protein [Acidobacteria bacterium]|nr:PAS domain-containing protein [Acidobacteriota bacterium]
MSVVTATLQEVSHPTDAQAAEVTAGLDEAGAYWQWDITGDIVGWSDSLYRIAGRNPETPLPRFKEHAQFYTSDSWHRLVSAVLKVFTTGAPFKVELRMVRPDRTIRWITCSGEAVRDAGDRIVRLRGVVEEVPKQTAGSRSREHPLASTHTAGPSAVDSLVDAYEEELARVSRQLTDDICQRLALIAIKVQQLGPRTADFMKEQPVQVEGLWQHVDETLSRVYRLAQELRPSVLDLIGVREAVRGLCREYSSRWRIRCECTVSIPADIESWLALSFFRICQAALRDVEVTGKARSMVIEFKGSGNDLLLRVIVNGEGVAFKHETQNRSAGFGLATIKEQVHLIAGDLVFWSDPLIGAQLEARAPLHKA